MRVSRPFAYLFVFAGLSLGVSAGLSACANDTANPDAGVRPDPATLSVTLGEAVAGIGGEGPLRAKLVTSRGMIIVELYDEKAPRAVANFVALARGQRPFKDQQTGEWVQRPFYDGLTFHRVVPGFMIQGGCPRGDGKGGPGYVFDDEFDESLRHDRAGVVAMVNAGPNTNGSQFYITDAPAPHLDGQHTIFGRVVDGLDVVQKIARVERGEDDRPKEPVQVLSVTFERG